MLLGERENEIYPYTTQNGQAKHMPIPPAHDWEHEQKHLKHFYDDGTMTYFCMVHLKRLITTMGLKRRGVQSDLDDITSAIETELRGHGGCLGYRSMTRRLITHHQLTVKRETVRQLLLTLDPEGVTVRKRHRLKRRVYVSKGPNYAIHMDGYDKLKPYGIAIHGAIDGFSRKIVWLRAAATNNNPNVIAQYFLDYVKEIDGLPRVMRADYGTENVLVEEMLVALRSRHSDDMSGNRSFIYGKSTSNQRIERWWGILRCASMQYYISLFKDFVSMGILSPGDDFQRECLRFAFLPLIQHDLDQTRIDWNQHRIRPTNHGECQAGKPDVMFYMPGLYGAVDYKFSVDQQDVEQVESCLSLPEPTCSPVLRERFDEIMANHGLGPPTTPDEAMDIYAHLIDDMH